MAQRALLFAAENERRKPPSACISEQPDQPGTEVVSNEDHARILLQARSFRHPAPPPVQAAYAAIASGQVRLIGALNTQIEELGEVVAGHFGRHRDADIYTSQRGLIVRLSEHGLMFDEHPVSEW